MLLFDEEGTTTGMPDSPERFIIPPIVIEAPPVTVVLADPEVTEISLIFAIKPEVRRRIY
jgi:hypothetical protein